jgi:hypothetical protein
VALACNARKNHCAATPRRQTSRAFHDRVTGLPRRRSSQLAAIFRYFSASAHRDFQPIHVCELVMSRLLLVEN